MIPKEICDCLNYITYGLYIVTSADGEKLNGMIVNTVFQLTAQPPKMAISVNKGSLTHEYIMKNHIFAAMPLEQATTLPFIGVFGFRSGRNFNKFEKINYKLGQLGCPIVLEHTLSYMEVQVQQSVDVGTHTLFIGEVKDADVIQQNGTPMTYEYYHTVIKGKAPKEATHL